MKLYKPVVIAVLDGWGIAPMGPGNAISMAATPFYNSLWQSYLHTQLIAHGESVGLPKREPGNTETGHLNIGAGRIVYQDLPRIDMSIADGSFFQNPVLLEAVNHAKNNHSNLHLLGLVGGGGVHSDIKHFFSLIKLFREQNLSNVFIHAFTDGRDSPPTSALNYINELQEVCTREGTGQIASVMGRYYAMDRDFRWDRTSRAYFCLTEGVGKKAASVQLAVNESYDQNETDEFIQPCNIINSQGQPLALIKDSDAVIFVNFRIDRPRQLTKAFILPDFEKTANKAGFDPHAVEYLHKHEVDDSQLNKMPPFSRPRQLQNLYFATMTEYEQALSAHVSFLPQGVNDPIGKIVSDHGLHQLRVSESEKERFVTYYFNGLQECPFSNENRVIIPSPRVPTYDKKPEMSALETTNRIISEVGKNIYDFIVINYANADMVAHTGNISATVKACETIDACLKLLVTKILSVDGVILVTSDHGNAEEMINLSTNERDTEHNANPVPLIIIGNDFHSPTQLHQGILADIAPTTLSLLNIPLPFTMTGRNLLTP